MVEVRVQGENRERAIKRLDRAYWRFKFFSLFGLAVSFVPVITLWPFAAKTTLNWPMVGIPDIYLAGVLLLSRQLYKVCKTLISTGELNDRQTETLKQLKWLERENALFRTLVENLPYNVIRYNCACQAVYVSPQLVALAEDAVARLLGKTPLEVRLNGWTEAANYQRTIERVIDSGESEELDVATPSFSGEMRLHHVQFIAERKRNGEICGVLAIGCDITGRKRMEAERAELQKRLESLADNLPGALSTCRVAPDGQGKMIYANRGLYDICGFTLEDLAEDIAPMVSRLHPDDRMVQIEKMAEAAGTLSTFSGEYRVNHPDKGEIWISHISTPSVEPDGSVLWNGLMFDITKRKQAEIELLRLEQEFRILAENLPDPVFRYTLDGKRSYVNKAVELISGQSMESLLAHSPDEAQLVSSADGAKLIACIRRVAETGLPSDIEVTFVAPDGVRHEYINRHVPEFGPNGEVVSVLAIGRDISAVRESERALLERKAFLDSLLNAIPIPVFYKDRQGRYLGFNPAFETFFGATQDELIGKDVYDINPRELAEIYYAKDAELFERGGVQQYESQVKSEQGVLRDVVFSKAVFCDSQGNIIGLIGTILDITERKRVAQTLEQREREFRTLVENIPDHIARYDRDCRTIYHNQQLNRSQGGPAGERLGKTPSELKPDGGFNHFEACIRQVIDSGEPSGCYVTLPDIGNGERFHQVRMVPEKNESGEVCGVLVVGRDITELKRSEMLREFSRKLLEEQNEQLRGYREKLEQKVAERTRELSTSNDQLRIEIEERKQAELKLEESKVQLRGLIAHREDIREEERKHIAREVHDELGQILSGLKLNVDILDSHYAGDSQPLRKHLKETMTLVGKAIDTVRNISSSLRPVELDLGIVYTLNLLAARFRTCTGIQCKVHVNDGNICLDENHAISLYRIAQEALTNVAKHAKASHVSIRLDKEANGYVLKVRDNGKGFDINECKANSFGLLGIRERVAMLGGTVTVNSSSGEGAEIAVQIPASVILEES